MRRRNNKPTDDSSLELLLDTICNTFGGIVLISILVALLMQTETDAISEQARNEISNTDIVRKSRELENAKQKLKLLQNSVQQNKQPHPELASEDSVIIARKLKQHQQLVNQLKDSNRNSEQVLIQERKQVDQLADTLKDLSKSLAETQNRLSQVNQQLDKEIKSHTEDLNNIPLVSVSNYQPVVFLLKNHTIWAFHTPDGRNIKLNEQECKISQELLGTFVDPIPAAGLLIDSRNTNQDQLEIKFRLFDRTRYSLQIWVTPDSHKEFESVKKTIVKLNMKYNLKLIAQDGRLSLTDKKERNRVQ